MKRIAISVCIVGLVSAASLAAAAAQSDTASENGQPSIDQDSRIVKGIVIEDEIDESQESSEKPSGGIGSIDDRDARPAVPVIKGAAKKNDRSDKVNDNANQPRGSPVRSDSFMEPLGPIAADQRTHLIWVTVLTLVAVVPVFVLLPLILFRYRRGRKTQETYQPKWETSRGLELLMWGVPIVLVLLMSARLWHSTHLLDPYKKIDSDNPTIHMQVIGLDWKWLFIFPDHGIATVGEFSLPIDHPASMKLTTDTVMQSFTIPALGGQIYAMPGMVTDLNLIADKLGTVEGENTQFNGEGFAGQKFLTHLVSEKDFERWVEEVRASGIPLNEANYKVLATRTKQSKAVADLATSQMPPGAIYFTVDDESFFQTVTMRYHRGNAFDPATQPGSPEYGLPDTSSSDGGDQ